MERNHIAILESLDLISVLMPYYGYTHEVFLVISALCKIARVKLIDRYEEFRKFMHTYSIVMEVSVKDLTELKFPLDFFKLKIDRRSLYLGVDRLITLTNKLMNKEGCYFDKHYMNEQLCFSRMYVHAEHIKDLYPYVTALESIKVAVNEQYYLCESQSLSSLIFINADTLFTHDEDELKLCYFKDSECKEADPIFQSFKRVGIMKLTKNEYTLRKLKMLKMAHIEEVEQLNLNDLNLKDMEKAINPENFNYPVHCITYSKRDCGLLSNLIFSNMFKVNPKELNLTRFTSISNAKRILSILPDNITINFNLIYQTGYFIKLNNLFIILENKGCLIKFYCDEVRFTYDILQQNDVVFLDSGNIIISNFRDMGVYNLKKEIMVNKETTNDLSFVPYEDEVGISILQNKLTEIKLDCSHLLNLLSNDRNKMNISQLRPESKISIELNSIDDVTSLNEVSIVLPKHLELGWDGNFYSDEQADVNSFDSAAFFELVTKFELRSFAIYNNYNTCVTSVLSNISVQNSLKNFKYYNCNLSECLEVLTLFSKYRLLETIEIECCAKNTDGYLQRITEAQIKIKHSNKNIRMIEIIYI